jgi:protein phosphatase inhibitor 2
MVAKKRHEDFAKKRAMHYNMGNVLQHSENDDSDNDDEQDSEDHTSIPPVPVVPK